MTTTNEKTTAREQRQQERFASRQSKTAATSLRRLRELPNAPLALDPFLKELEAIYVHRASPLDGQGRKLVGITCVMVPQELIYAAGAQPVKLCSGDHTAFFVGDDLVPRDACPLVKAVAGFVRTRQMPLYEDCSLMVIPVTCDCKKKIAGMLSEVRPVMALHVPATREDGDIDGYVLQLYELIRRLEEATGQRVTYDSLAEGMQTVAAAQQALSVFSRLRRKDPYLLWGSHALAVMSAASTMPALRWTAALRELNRELSLTEPVTQKALPRILLTGSPIVFPNLKIPLLLEEAGAILAADETCLGERGLWDPAVPVDPSFDGLLRSLANRALRPCPCPTFADNSQRIYRIRQLVKENQIQGVLYHVLRGCLVYDFEYKKLEEEMGRLGVPIIRVETDYNDEDVEQLRIRIEAFIELIRLQ